MGTSAFDKAWDTPPQKKSAFDAAWGDDEKDGLLSRTVSRIGSGLSQIVAHPIDTAVGMAKSIGSNAIDAVLTPEVGDSRPNPSLSKGGNSAHLTAQQLAQPYDAAHGAQAVGGRTNAGLSTAANLAFPAIAEGGGMLRLAAAGGVAGAAGAPDDRLAGGLAGAAMAPLLRGTAQAGAGVIRGGARLASAPASKVVDLIGRPIESRPLLPLPGGRGIGQITGLREMASDAIGRRAEMDASAGYVPQSMHKSVPSLALDAAGPNVEGLAEGIANRPGPGRAQIVNAVSSRSQQMRPAISGALEENTGVPADARMQPLEQAIAERSRVAGQLYQQAREATAGQPIDSPTLQDILKTPVGKSAFAWAKMQMGNRNKSLPQVTQAGGESATLREMVDMGVPRDKAVAALGDTAMDPPTSTELPDPETLHYMKQALAKIARLGMNDGAQGTVATQAHGALGQWGAIRDELPDVWRKADDAFAEHSRGIDAMNAGRNIFRTGANPAGNPRKAVLNSLDAVQSRYGAVAPDALQAGAATAAHSLWDAAPLSTRSPGRVFARSPQVVQQLRTAFAGEPAAADFQHAVSSWDRVQEQANRLTGNSRTGLRGAEGSGSGLAPQDFLGSARMLARKIATKVGGAAQGRHQQALEAEIAKMLTSPDVLKLPVTARMPAVESAVMRRLTATAALAGSQSGGSQP